MAEVFVIADLHLYHKNVIKFTKEDGTLLRPGFHDIHHMHAIIMENWAKRVKPADKVYVLGDVTFHNKGLALLRELPGHKRLVRGNHDLLKTREYMTVFQEIYGVRQIDGYWLTHVPMHPDCMYRAKLNIHGHLHAKNVKMGWWNDPRYFNVSVEQINYTPISLDEIKRIAK